MINFLCFIIQILKYLNLKNLFEKLYEEWKVQPLQPLRKLFYSLNKFIVTKLNKNRKLHQFSIFSWTQQILFPMNYKETTRPTKELDEDTRTYGSAGQMLIIVFGYSAGLHKLLGFVAFAQSFLNSSNFLFVCQRMNVEGMIK